MKIKIPKIVRQTANLEDAPSFLVYVNDHQPGIRRLKSGKGFRFLKEDQPLKTQEELLRIKKLAIPPAWTNVWVCSLPNGHIQATGFDVRNRKQYRYHTLWNELRKQTKFHKMHEFGKFLPVLRLQLEKDIAKKELCEQKVIAALISVMERTYIRIGNSSYEKENGSYGLTTLKDRHVKIEGGSVQFTFKGKKGISHSIGLKNRRLAKIIQQCKDIPGKDLFQYYTPDGHHKTVDSGMVNAYLKNATGQDFTAKDFRTWAGSLQILRAFRSVGDYVNETDKKSKINHALAEVSAQLGNTVNVCRKYYVHPTLISMYEQRSLLQYLEQLDALEKTDGITGLTQEENLLMLILESFMTPAKSA
ncbi:MAG: DNA topoisomerase IB [Bacteroidota bacterium]